MVQTLNERSPGRERVRKRLEERRRHILQAAGRTFRRLGYAAAGMREIAAEAELSPGNLYHYFKGKHEILFFCQDRALDRLLTALAAAEVAGEGHAERLRTLVEAHAHCILDELEGTAAHLEVDALPDDMRRVIVDKRDRYERGVRRLVSAGMESGELAQGDPDLITRALLGGINWTVRWFNPGGTRSAAEVGRELARFMVRGLTGGAV